MNLNEFCLLKFLKDSEGINLLSELLKNTFNLDVNSLTVQNDVIIL